MGALLRCVLPAPLACGGVRLWCAAQAVGFVSGREVHVALHAREAKR